MTQQRLLFIDIDAKASNSTLWNRSDNSFRFNFLTDNPPPAPQVESPPSGAEAGASQRIAFTGQGSDFAFNFQIPPATTIEDMETAETAHSQQSVQVENPSVLQEANSESKVKKKKKKSGKKNMSHVSEPQQQQTEGSQAGKDIELSAEEQLNRQLDWCIEHLELGLRTQKGTPKQKEEASRALKTLRSSKAPLAKKRQLMRTMAGDYRKKMEEEKSKQFKLIQSEIASAHVKVVAESPKKSVFHRRAEVKAKMPAAEEIQQQSESQDTEPAPQTQDEMSTFVFTPSKEEFHFNFL
ncbi:UPF0488 protein C8orf33 homolog [Parambassis ranga]|uniref:UPF0488 protein C8orf33 homolog n=1 Tax=Parambassis ranga TaxID=210632 RepID=A0A6P7IM48_9TELE|nr:UPF0488 protein C8orf33 homolog [Parambassis ranga]